MSDGWAEFCPRVVQCATAGGFLTSVTHDSSLAGAGTPASPLSVVAGAAAVPALVASGQVTNASQAPLVIAWPTPPPTIEPGALMIVAMVSSAGTYGTPGIPSGFQAIGGALPQAVGAGSANWLLTFAYKVLDSGDIGAASSGQWGVGGTVLSVAAGIFQCVGQQGGWRLAGAPAVTISKVSASPTVAPWFPSRNNQLVIAAIGSNGGVGQLTPPSDYTTIENVPAVGGTNFGLWLGFQLTGNAQVGPSVGVLSAASPAWASSQCVFEG